MLSVLATILAAASALALYAASPHCMWAALRGHARTARRVGWVLALLALVAWIDALGGIVGLCAMLASWMLALMLQPCLARLFGTPAADPTARSQS